jgi:hypothetical protein
MTRHPYRNRNTIIWSAAVLVACTIAEGVIVRNVFVDPLHWILPGFIGGVIWLIVATVCCPLIEEAVRRQRRARHIVPDEQMRYGRLPAVTRARSDVPFDEYLDDPQTATEAPTDDVDDSWTQLLDAVLVDAEHPHLRRAA